MSVYNCEKYIAETLASIQAQTFRDIRIIVIDDGSTDRTGDIVREVANKDARIEYHRQENAGIVAALNAGLPFCDAELIARHDGDDISYPDRFEKELAYLKTHPDCVAVSGLARHIDSNSHTLNHVTKAKDLSKADPFSIPANEPYIMQPLLMVRRETLGKAGGYRYLSVAEDTDLYWRLSDAGQLHIIPDIMGDYRIHSGSISSGDIVSGRQQAVWSQLAALSEQRRRKDEPDISFSRDSFEAIRSCSDLDETISAAHELIDKNEYKWFDCAVAAKILEICYYRPYEPEKADIDIINTYEKLYPSISEYKGYDIFVSGKMSCAIRLIGDGRVLDALSLIGWLNMPVAVARASFRYLIPENYRKLIKRFVKKIL
nr:glycosyltransferase family A protein [Acetobacter oeni]